MSKRRGLGKGLGALIPGLELSVTGQDQSGNEKYNEIYKEINIEDIKPAPSQARQLFNQEKLDELAASIKEHGVIQPVLVRNVPDGGYELIAGERRWRACKLLGYKVIPAVVKDCQDLEATAVALVENIQRENLNPLEEALAYNQLIDNYGLTQEEVSGRVGKSRPFVANMVRLLGLPVEIKEMLAEGQLNTGHARTLLSIQDKKKQLAVAGKIVKQQLSVRQVEKIVKNLTDDKGKEKNEIDFHKQYIQEIEEALGNYLGVGVRLREVESGGGKLEINYSSEEDLKRIIEMMLGEPKKFHVKQ
ncbi:MAG: putative chromosome-partitioning protein ParB [Pelotomaculum sp. PtaU1.Bin035]|nr:MAG: putative chromosome-partitioning protein ParB [Pelotomaculum sp. PtaU1.Bin035]